ncbi:hypothetical protein GYA44_01160 [Candidatus Microgenomates bacterium]|jgi:hypothetical protein|nr:hypothetical protein [Candidatus Microgenomates bacterium]
MTNNDIENFKPVPTSTEAPVSPVEAPVIPNPLESESNFVEDTKDIKPVKASVDTPVEEIVTPVENDPKTPKALVSIGYPLEKGTPAEIVASKSLGKPIPERV